MNKENTKNIVKVETIEELAIKLPDDFAEVGEKVNVAIRDDGSLEISKLVTVELDLPNDVLLGLTMMAHEQDITLNELCNNILREIVETDGKCLGLDCKHDWDCSEEISECKKCGQQGNVN